MASAWNVVRARNYGEVNGSENGASPASSPVPDKFKQKFTVNSLRMSIRKRIPLKRINVNGASPDYYRSEPWKQKVEDAKRKESAARSAKVDKARGVALETSMKKTLFKMTEQLTGATKKRQLKETPQKSTPRTRYRERLRSPPDTPSSPANITGFNSPCYSTPIGQVKSLRRYRRTPGSEVTKRSSVPKGSQNNRRRDSDDFSRHLELISCGIQQLESNSNNMLAAISHIGLDYEASPLQKKIRGRLWKDEMRNYDPLSPEQGSTSAARTKSEKNGHSQPTSSRGMLRRTMTRMSLRVKNRPSLRSTKSASNIQASCYTGPMASVPRKLAPLREFSAQSK